MIVFDPTRVARAALVAGVMAAGLTLSGCLASPTYGTDKTANQQLVEDLTGMIALAPKKGPRIDYKPRPELVEPETTAVLPPPQDDVITASSEAWPESPEERLARVRAEADANRDNPFYRPNVISDTSKRERPVIRDDRFATVASARQQREEVLRRRQELNGGDESSRKYLSEPPLDYRRPADSAPAGDLGEPEWKKDRNARRDSRAAAAATEAPKRSSLTSNF